MVRLGVAVSVLLGAGPGLAGCPAHVSALAAVELSRAEPFMANVYRQTPEGLTEARVMERDGAVEAVSTIYPHPLAPGRRISTQGTLVLDYAADLADLDRLDVTGTWRSAVVLRVDGQAVLEGQAEKRFAGTGRVRLGDCLTEVWLVEDRLEPGPGDGSWMLLSYAPELGLVVGSVVMSAEGQARGGVAFDRIAVLAE